MSLLTRFIISRSRSLTRNAARGGLCGGAAAACAGWPIVMLPRREMCTPGGGLALGGVGGVGGGGGGVGGGRFAPVRNIERSSVRWPSSSCCTTCTAVPSSNGAARLIETLPCREMRTDGAAVGDAGWSGGSSEPMCRPMRWAVAGLGSASAARARRDAALRSIAELGTTGFSHERSVLRLLPAFASRCASLLNGDAGPAAIASDAATCSTHSLTSANHGSAAIGAAAGARGACEAPSNRRRSCASIVASSAGERNHGAREAAPRPLRLDVDDAGTGSGVKSLGAAGTGVDGDAATGARAAAGAAYCTFS